MFLRINIVNIIKALRRLTQISTEVKKLVAEIIAIVVSIPVLIVAFREILPNENHQLKNIKFICENYQTIMINTDNNERRAIINWQLEIFIKAGYPPVRRCELVTQQFEKANQSGSLKYLAKKKLNKQPVICALKSKKEVNQDQEICTHETLIMTLLHKEDHNIILLNLKATISGKGGIVNHNETKSTNGNNYIDIEEELKDFSIKQ